MLFGQQKDKQRMIENVMTTTELWPRLSEEQKAETSVLIVECLRELALPTPKGFLRTMRYGGERECIVALQALCVDLAQR